MSDISICISKTCRLRLQCYRATAKRSKYQSVILTKDDTNENPCVYFWDKDKR